MREVFEEMGKEEKTVATGMGRRVPQRLQACHPTITRPHTRVSPGVRIERQRGEENEQIGGSEVQEQLRAHPTDWWRAWEQVRQQEPHLPDSGSPAPVGERTVPQAPGIHSGAGRGLP